MMTHLIQGQDQFSVHYCMSESNVPSHSTEATVPSNSTEATVLSHYYLVPSAFQLTLYGSLPRKVMFSISMDTGCDPGKPDLLLQNMNYVL